VPISLPTMRRGTRSYTEERPMLQQYSVGCQTKRIAGKGRATGTFFKVILQDSITCKDAMAINTLISAVSSLNIRYSEEDR